jgi:hypothetical protein
MQSKPAIKIAATTTLMLLALAALTVAPTRGYGVAQWQAAFSFTCNAPTCAGFGFWGWCDFAGSAANGLSGTSADCEFSNYNFNGAFGIPAFGSFHVSQDINSWHIATGSFALPPGMPGFFADSGSVTFTGQGAKTLGLPTNAPLDFVPLCSVGLFFLCDTGIPAVPGHFTLSTIPVFGVPSQPGANFEVQITQISA